MTLMLAALWTVGEPEHQPSVPYPTERMRRTQIVKRLSEKVGVWGEPLSGRSQIFAIAFHLLVGRGSANRFLTHCCTISVSVGVASDSIAASAKVPITVCLSS
jgi:hypothetical protein